MPARLTTLGRCKAVLFSGDIAPTDQFDALLDSLINELSADVEIRLDRKLASASYVEYVDGSGVERLLLAQGPISTLTSVEELTYSKSGIGALVITAATVAAGDYFIEAGSRSAGDHGCGVLRRYSGSWAEGTRNYRVTYTAGWVDDPDDANGYPWPLVRAVTNRVVGEFQRRGLMGLISKAVGDGSLSSTIPDANWDAALERSIQPYRRMRVA